MQFKEETAGLSTEMPAKMVIYGVPKIGKSRFAAQADDPFFIDLENGLQYVGKKVRKTPHLKEYDDVAAWMKHIYENDSFKAGTIVIDSLDWLEKLAQRRLIKKHGASSITDPSVSEFSYYKGVSQAAQDTFAIIRWLEAIYKKRGTKAILIAHNAVKDVNTPGRDTYQRNEMKLSSHKEGLAPLVNEWADLILFADYSFHVTSDGMTSEQKPVLYAGGSASFVGGGRMKLKQEIPLDYKKLKEEIEK